MNDENGGTERAERTRAAAQHPEHLALVQRRMDALAAHGVVASDWRRTQSELWGMIRDGTVHSLDGHSAAACSDGPRAAAEIRPDGHPPGGGP